MKHLAFVFLLASVASAQFKQPMTPWGHPDLQGVWTSTSMIGTPLQRAAALGERTEVTDEEFERRARQSGEFQEFDTALFVSDKTRCDPNKGGLGNTPDTCSNGVSIGPPLYWQDRGTPNRVASLVVEPKDGRIPALTASARDIAASRGAARRGRGQADSFEDRSLWERCVTRGALPFLPTGYNNGSEIVQTPQWVAIRIEMIHETRFVPLDGRPLPGPEVRSYMGYSRGHWEGNTLVVESSNFSANAAINGTPLSDAARLIERFTMTDANTLNYEVTVNDPKTWAGPFKIAFPLKHEEGYKLYEYACHEANYFMYDALTGARKAEKAAQP